MISLSPAGRLDREQHERVHHALDHGGGGAGQHVQRRDRHRLLVLRGARGRPHRAAAAGAVARAARYARQPAVR